MPEPDLPALPAALAQTVRALRTRRGWSLEALAKRAGVSKGVLVALEQGSANPSLGTLIRISDTFGIPLARLVQVEEEPGVRLVPARRHVVLWQGEHGGCGTLIAGTDPRPSTELWRWELQPDESRSSEPHQPGCREIAWVEEGALTLSVAGQTHRIAAGDAATFRGDAPHGYANAESVPLAFTLVVLDI